MPTFLNGLPLHPLVVHAVVVLVPLAALGGIAVAVWPAARRRYGSLVVAVGVVALVSTVVAEQLGEGLQQALPDSPAIRAHAALGDDLKWWVAALVVLTAALVLAHDRTQRRIRQEGPGATVAPAAAVLPRVVAVGLAVLVVAAAVVAGVEVFLVGDAGARAVWGGIAR